MADVSREEGTSKACFNTRVVTGKARHAQRIDARTLWGRRDREVYNAVIADLGGAEGLSELEHQVVRRCVGLILQCERFEARLAEGAEVDIGPVCTLVNSFLRASSLIGLKRRAKDITPNLRDLYIEHGGDIASDESGTE